MMLLTREVRFTIPGDRSALDGPVLNSWGGWPTVQPGDVSGVLRCTLRGQLDPATAYLCDIGLMDRAVREDVVGAACGQAAIVASWPALVKFAWQQLKARFSPEYQLERVTILPNPWIAWSRDASDESMIYLTQQFEFSAAHRLHNPGLSAADNRQMFGKCNNPHGHGHNYVVEVTVAAETGADGQVSPETMKQIVRERVIDRLDHKFLNVEVGEFQELNPSVENIAIVIWDWLDNGIPQGQLHNVRVYETPKTWADFSGHGASR